ncbi:LOG family protein [Thetidibacter halocola]|uniref:AMP nucleosidase n=1 Tax=Thetidibacter halocola TaxID=2827239 RepID=A0A8J7WGH6_9RHOB|nr:LOG family protein [Thetidibacter halocola]MBS0126014.1 LOG family protein [Thetidibacter halocola]
MSTPIQPEGPAPDTAKPDPPHPVSRHCPLPGETPKPDSVDPQASALVEAILASPEYREADRDIAFLQKDSNRGLRLQLDFDKAEELLDRHGIAHTIVVFGSTRVSETAEAHRRVADLEAQAKADPGCAETAQALRIARRVAEKSRYYDIARDFGRLVGEAEDVHGKRMVVLTGGGPGLMEAANRGAHDAGARTVGLNITLPHEQFPNPYLTPGLCFRFHYFAVRKMHFLLRARALVVFPGGYGTMDELFETLTLIQTRKIAPVPVILVGEAYWRRAFDPDFLVEEGVIDPEDRALFWYAETAGEIWSDILRWHERAGTALTR